MLMKTELINQSVYLFTSNLMMFSSTMRLYIEGTIIPGKCKCTISMVTICLYSKVIYLAYLLCRHYFLQFPLGAVNMQVGFICERMQSSHVSVGA